MMDAYSSARDMLEEIADRGSVEMRHYADRHECWWSLYGVGYTATGRTRLAAVELALQAAIAAEQG